MQTQFVAPRLLRAERADARSVKQSVRFQPSMPRTSVGRCATPGASHPPAVRTQSTVTFLNGRNGDICIWWTHARGIVSKRADAAYAPGNRGLWLKIKCLHREEFVVIGWTNPEGSRPFLGALLLAYYVRPFPVIRPGACLLQVPRLSAIRALCDDQPGELRFDPTDDPQLCSRLVRHVFAR